MRRTLLVVVCYGAILVGILFLATRSISQVPQNPPAEDSDIDFSLPTQTPINDALSTNKTLTQTAWIPDWAFNSGYSSLQAAASNFSSVSPVWYYLEAETGVREAIRGLPELRNFTEEQNILLVPSIASFDADALHATISTTEGLSAHVTYLIDEVQEHGYDGLDIDYESTYLQDQVPFLQFICELNSQLSALGKITSVTVISNWTESDIFRTLRQTRQAQNWMELSHCADEIRIMAYDLTSYTSTYPGPVAPLDWTEAILRKAIRDIDRSKIVLSLPLYGYDGWSGTEGPVWPYLGILANPGAGKGLADAVTDSQLVLARSHLTSEVISPDSSESLLTYEYEGKKYYVYYPTVETTKHRISLAKDYKIGGIAYWRMGGEDIEIYNLINY